MIERHDAEHYEPERFLEHLRSAATAIDGPFDESKVRRSLKIFNAELLRCVIQLKATCKPGSGVYYRFFYKWDRDLTAVAQRHGLLPAGPSPIVDLQSQILERFSGATRAGLDFETGHGLCKIWTFTGGPQPIDDVLALPAIPDAARQHREFFKNHGLCHVFFVGSDVQHNSMNIYFGLEPDCRHSDWLRELLAATGGGPEDSSMLPGMMSSLAVSAGVGTTWKWDSNEMGRWCLYALGIPAVDLAGSKLPALPPRLKAFRDQAPSLNSVPQFNVAWSFGRDGHYTKLEKSYAKDADHFLTVEMGGNLSHSVG